MTGEELYVKEYMDKVEKIINNNLDKPYLRGFSYYLRKCSTRTIHSYMSLVVNFINYCNKNVSEINIDDYNGYLITKDSEKKNYTSSYEITIYSALKKFSAYLYVSGLSSNDYMESVDRPKYKEKRKTTIKRDKSVLTEDEVCTIISQIKENKENKFRERDLFLITLLIYTGMRCAALYKLDIDNIDYENRVLFTVDKGNVDQEFDLNSEMMKMLRDWLEVRNEICPNNEKALFVSKNKSRMTKRGIMDVVQRHCGYNSKGIKISPHKLRATFGTALYEKTGDIQFVCAAMGHKSIQTTGLYIRNQKKSVRKKSASIMSEMLFEK